MQRIPYDHEFKDYEDLVTFLVGREGSQDLRYFVRQKLEAIGYQRLKSYIIPRKSAGLETLHDFFAIWKLHCFDRRIRFVLLDAIERVEVAIRNKITHSFSQRHGAFGHRIASNFYSSCEAHAEWIDKLDNQVKRNQSSPTVRDFFSKYTNDHLPLWDASEFMDFGSIVFFYRSLAFDIQRSISHSLGLPSSDILTSWLTCLNDVRNACAHHNRVWNRTWTKMPQIPRKGSWRHTYLSNTGEWIPSNKMGSPSFEPSKTGCVLSICAYLLDRVATTSSWKGRFISLTSDPNYAHLPISLMGLPVHWQSHPLWNFPPNH